MTTAALSVLLIEDNHAISANIADYFYQQSTQHNVVLDFATNGKQGLMLALSQYYDVIILDLSLPGLDGIEVCAALRQQADRHIPIIMLTARDTLDDKLQGFGSGADDYLTKPFALAELWARVQVITRRQTIDYLLRVNDIELNKQTRFVSRQGQPIVLKPIAWQILCLLMEAHPRPLSRSELCSKIWGDTPTESDALRSHFYQLRKAIDQPFEQPVLKTLHGVGFALQDA